mgnify:CR=1 FL=1
MFGYVTVSTTLPDDIGMTQSGTKDFNELFNERIFTFPKPVSLIEYFVKITTQINKDVLILDLFSGSATTAHAVLKLNAEDDGKRKFIMVQIPEATDEKSEAYKAGYKTITDKIAVTIKPLYRAPIIFLLEPNFTKKVPAIEVSIHEAPIASG